jgi:putative membrane protein
MSGELKHTFEKVTDALGGTVGKISASATSSAEGFVENAMIGNLYEIEAARIAMQRTTSEPIRVFAKKMLLDHMTATHQLGAALEMSETEGVAEPSLTLDARREAMIKHLADAPEHAFDTTYVDQQVLAHEETVTLMRTYAESGDNPQLRSVALGSLPVMERHLNHAKMMKAQPAE